MKRGRKEDLFEYASPKFASQADLPPVGEMPPVV